MKAVDELTAARLEAENLTNVMEDRTKAKRAAITNANMPVSGLSFDESQVLYNGFPLEQASAAEQLRVSFAIAAAANPRLAIALIRDGSLLDEKSLADVGAMADAHNMQVWIERVDTSGKVGIVLEDGAVTSIDGVPVEQQEAVAV